MFGSLDARPLELSAFETRKRRSLAFWGATCWCVLALGEAAFIWVRYLSAAPRDGSWLLALGMVMLIFFWAVSFRERSRLEHQLALGAEDDRKNALLFAYRNTVHAVAAAGVVAFLLLVSLRWIAFAPASGR